MIKMEKAAFLLLAIPLALTGITAAIYRLAKRGDFFVITLFGKPFAFRNPIREDSYGIAAPFIRPVNEFLADFANSTEKQIEFTPDDIKPSSTAPPLLRALQGMDYERIRLRLRVISSLNPIVNLKTEEGLIQFTCISRRARRRKLSCDHNSLLKDKRSCLRSSRPSPLTPAS